MAVSSTTMTGTEPSNTATTTTTTVAMTSVFTPPPACASSWTYEPAVYNNVEPSGLLMQNCERVVPSCFPSQFADSGRQTATVVYSPGYCPMGYTSADVAITGSTTTAICCYSNFSYTTSTMFYSDLPPAIYAGCTSTFASSTSTIVSVRASQSGEGTMIFGPMAMWAQPITVLLQPSDSSLFASSTSTSTTSTSTTSSPTSGSTTISTTIPYSTMSPTPTPQPSPLPSTGLSVGAKAGIGIGVAIGVLVVLSMVGWWLRSRKTKSMPPPYSGNHYSSGNAAPMASSGFKYGLPVEMDNSVKSTNPISELQG